MASPESIDRADHHAAILRWDQCCDLLGGATWEQAVQQWESNGLSAGQDVRLNTVAPYFSHPEQFLFKPGNQSVTALECFWLKWNLIVDLCRAVLSIHEGSRRPHLGLEPARVLVSFPSGVNSWLPARWRFSLEGLDAGSATPFAGHDMPSEMAQSLFVPPASSESIYSASLIRQWPFGQDIPVTGLIRSLDQIDDESGQTLGLLRVDLISDHFAHEVFSHQDVFRITLPLAQGNAGFVRLWARKLDRLERGVVVSGITDPLTSEEWGALRKASQEIFSRATAKTYRSFHIPCDVYSVGALLCRALLVNRSQTLQAVQSRLVRVIEGLDPIVQGLEPGDDWTLHSRVSSRLKEEGSVFSSAAVLFSHDAPPPSAALVSDDVWYDALVLGLRCMSWIPGFSVCPGPMAYDVRQMHQPLQQMTREAEALAHRIRIELFQAGVRNVDIRQACNRVRAEVAAMGTG
jgi:hypothetical protein